MSDAKHPSSSPAEPNRSPRKSGEPPIEFKPPLKPRPLLAVILGLLLVLWLAALIVMRLKTVQPATAPSAPSGIESPK
jgi:hypothetical protein